MRSLSPATRLLLAAGLLAFTPVVHAEKNEDIYNRGQAAVNKGDAIGARDAFCSVDSGYKDAAQQCSLYRSEATKMLNRYNQNFLEGVQLMQEGKLDQAEFKFRNVKAGDRVESAQRKLQDIQKLRQEQQTAAAQAGADAALRAKFDAGVEAFNRGDFGSARSNFQQAGGRFAADAQNYTSKMSQYESKIAEAGRLAQDKRYADAIASYGDAIALVPNGPGDPRGQIRAMQGAMAASGTAPRPTPTLPRPEKARIDENAYIEQAKKYIGRQDFTHARRILNEVIAQNFRNDEASSLLKSLPQEERSGSTAGEEDKALSAAIRDFYGGNFADAEARLRGYRLANPKKPGLGNFYLGVTLMTQYFLSASPDPKQRIEAIKLFKEAHETQGFVVPERYVSPRIVKVYREANPAPQPGP